MKRKVREEVQEGVFYVKPRKAQGKKSRSKRKITRRQSVAARGGIRTLPIKRHDGRSSKTERASDHYLDTRRPETLAQLSRMIANDFRSITEAAQALGIAPSTLYQVLAGRRKSSLTREKLCRYYRLPISIFGAPHA